MTAIAPSHIKTKKALKEAISAGKPLLFQDPNPWGYSTIRVNTPNFPLLVDGTAVEPGYSFTCTNHPRRSWFATISLSPSGQLKVS
jgi:hypothetical protein